MFPLPTVLAVVPCYNEAVHIGFVVREMRKYVERILVVDDGSSDGTGELARQAGAEILRHPATQGKGAALQSGLRHARQLGFEWVLALDGDGQHDPADIPQFLSASASIPLVVGNRMPQAAKIPWLRRQVNRWMSRRISRLAGCFLPDTQCGFRRIHIPSWAQVKMETRRFEIESEMLLSFVAAGYPIEFIPVEVIYRGEQSKIRPWRDTIRWFHWWNQAQAEFRAARSRREESDSAAAALRGSKSTDGLPS